MANRLKNAINAKTHSIQHGQPYRVGPSQDAPELPERAGALPQPLQVIARQYIGARRRSGEALLDAARWLSEARAIASHGDWKLFKEATGTSDDAAERLLNIHIQALQNPQFADSVARNWLGQSAAALLARESTPPSVMEAMINAPRPPKVADIKNAIREARPKQQAPPPPEAPQSDQQLGAYWIGPMSERFRTTAEQVSWCAEHVGQLDEQQRGRLKEPANRLVAELEALIEALS